ncbi:MAG: hypothetical protein ACE5IB_03175 [Candidatus Geothermarchaeales archaeon]
MTTNRGMRTSVLISVTAVLGAIAAVISFMKLEIPFPLLYYLKVDAAEIPTVAAFFIFGPIPGVLTATVHWLVLNPFATFPVWGPLLKFSAVLSMLLGLQIGTSIYRRLMPGRGVGAVILSMFLFGSIVRVAVMTVVNFIVLSVLFPSLLEIAGGMFWTLLITGFYNIFHVVVSIIPTYLAVPALARLLPKRIVVSPWLHSLSKKMDS